MRINSKLITLTAGLSALALPSWGAAESATVSCHHYANGSVYCDPPVYWRLSREPGWRHRGSIGDSSCFNSPWLASEYACSADGE